MTNKFWTDAARLIACLLAVIILFGAGAGSVTCAFAADDDVTPVEEPSASFTPPDVPYTEVTDPVDLTRDCELTVYPCGSGASFKDDIDGAEITMDLYKIADAKVITGVDSYDYTLVSAFSSLSAQLAKARKVADGVDNKAEWDKLAQDAAAIVKGGSVTPFLSAVKAEDAESVVIAGTEDKRFLPGLYLIVPHTDATDYWKAQSSANDPILSVAYTDYYYYYYQPLLVSMPYKREAIPAEGVVMTSDDGGWYYGLKVYLKPEQQAYADLWIQKTLRDYHVDSDAIFVFYVDAVMPVTGEDGTVTNEKVYSKAFSILFDKETVNHFGDNVKFTVARNVPIGSTVTVTEEYQGSSCEPVGTTVYTGTMTRSGLLLSSGDVLQPVPFVNKGNGTNGGGGIENTYTYEPTASGGAWGNGTQNGSPGVGSMPEDETQGS